MTPETDDRLPPLVGILIASGLSAVLWISVFVGLKLAGVL